MSYSQHQSNFNAFFNVRKTFPQPGEGKEEVHFFSKQSLPETQTTTRFYKARSGEWLKLTGTFLDAHENVNILNISLTPSKKLADGTVIPEQIIVDISCPVEGKVDRIQMSSNSKWGEGFARKIINGVDLSKPVTIRPFSYIPEGKKKLSEGMSIVQDGVKIEDKYTKYNGTEKPTNINGVEAFDSYADEAKTEPNKTLRSNAWTSYFARVNVFVIGEMMKFVKEANFVDSATAGATTSVAAKEIVPDYPEEEINPEDLPF